MKKLFSILLILTLCLTAFTACGGKAEPDPVPTAALPQTLSYIPFSQLNF